MISRTIFCSAQAPMMLLARIGPMPVTSRGDRARLDHVEHLLAERPDHLPGVDRADAADHFADWWAVTAIFARLGRRKQLIW